MQTNTSGYIFQQRPGSGKGNNLSLEAYLSVTRLKSLYAECWSHTEEKA